jgi:hypothetical protein
MVPRRKRVMVGVVVFSQLDGDDRAGCQRVADVGEEQTNLYAATITQIYGTQGEAGVREFLDRIRDVDTVTEVNLVRRDGRLWLADSSDISNYQDVIAGTFDSSAVELELNSADNRTHREEL